eukprot:TRINITY_DN272_c2_g1_i1.p1 TRINITY_DN272_c2_g1~~TRINITY_DN272_c2_g1_i1.p1  ORF type:complete len:308 (+),score=19.05 TRINITY_DN272_c2_g1_i1:105-926(+)
MEVYTLACAETYYAFTFWVYDKFPLDGKATKVVQHLVRALPGPGYSVFMDRGFTLVPLLQWLFQHGHSSIGTAKVMGKTFPKDLVYMEDGAERGDVKVAIDRHGMCCVVWVDRQPCAFLWTEFGTAKVWAKRRVLDEQPEIEVPEIAAEYNTYKDAVDQGDKMCLSRHGGSMQQEAQGHKWWHDLFWGLFDRTVTNAWILYREIHGDLMTRVDFLRKLQKEVVENTEDGGPATRGQKRKRDSDIQMSKEGRFDGKGHLIAQVTKDGDSTKPCT